MIHAACIKERESIIRQTQRPFELSSSCLNRVVVESNLSCMLRVVKKICKITRLSANSGRRKGEAPVAIQSIVSNDRAASLFLCATRAQLTSSAQLVRSASVSAPTSRTLLFSAQTSFRLLSFFPPLSRSMLTTSSATSVFALPLSGSISSALMRTRLSIRRCSFGARAPVHPGYDFCLLRA